MLINYLDFKDFQINDGNDRLDISVSLDVLNPFVKMRGRDIQKGWIYHA